MNSIMRRRSTRKFLEKPVEPDKLERILRAAMQSPTGHDRREWEFLIVTEPAALVELSKMGQYSMCAKNAPMAIVVLCNLDREYRQIPLLWSCDMGAACQTILIQAEEEGLGAVWLMCWPSETRMANVRRQFDLPENLIPYAVLPLGYKQRVKDFEDRFDPDKIHWERYGARTPAAKNAAEQQNGENDADS